LPSDQKIYVLGAGAVGCYFGGMLARAHHDVTFIARPERAAALNDFGLEMDCKAFHETVRVKASPEIT
jgi:2-dehydropantoate 2-reductase